MAYAIRQDIVERYGTNELIVAADHDEDGTADTPVVEQGLQDASEEIDVYLGGRYALPLAVVPPVLKRLCVDMAMYLMSKPPSVTEEKRKRYEDAVKLLTLIGQGKITLGASDPENTDGSCGAFFQADPRLFGRRKS